MHPLPSHHYTGYFDAWGHTLEASSDYTTNLVDYITDSEKVFRHALSHTHAQWHHHRPSLCDTNPISDDRMCLCSQVFVMLSHGGCIARGEDAAHVFALVHGVDAAAEIQVYAEMTGFPLMEIDKERVCVHGSKHRTLTPLPSTQPASDDLRLLLAFDSVAQVKTFPRHNYGDMTSRTKRMVQVFAASKRLLLCDWNQGFRNCGDSAFVL